MEAVVSEDLLGTVYIDDVGVPWVVVCSGGDEYATWWKLFNLETGELFQLWDDYVRSDTPNSWLKRWVA